jgi:hypothetical protein
MDRMGVPFLASDNTWTGENTFEGETLFNADVGIDADLIVTGLATFTTTVSFTGTSITGDASAYIRLENTTDVTLASTTHAFQIGPDSDNNLAIDSNEIQARNNGAKTTLNLNAAGGGVNISTAGDTTTIQGAATVDEIFRLTRGSSLTIAAGVITVTGSHHLVDTQGGAATDDLDTINGAVGAGHVLVLSPVNSARDIVVKNATGNIFLGGADKTLTSTNNGVMLVYNGSGWMGGL